MPNKRTKKRKAAVAAIEKVIAAAIPEAFPGDAHAYLMAVYKDPSVPIGVRVDAARAALPFEKPRLAPLEQKPQQDDHVPLAERLKGYARKDAIEASSGKVVELRK